MRASDWDDEERRSQDALSVTCTDDENFGAYMVKVAPILIWHTSMTFVNGAHTVSVLLISIGSYKMTHMSYTSCMLIHHAILTSLVILLSYILRFMYLI